MSSAWPWGDRDRYTGGLGLVSQLTEVLGLRLWTVSSHVNSKLAGHCWAPLGVSSTGKACPSRPTSAREGKAPENRGTVNASSDKGGGWGQCTATAGQQCRQMHLKGEAGRTEQEVRTQGAAHPVSRRKDHGQRDHPSLDSSKPGAGLHKAQRQRGGWGKAMRTLCCRWMGVRHGP